ncbi:hypothetical protein D3C84_676330 [compost metagenome]
MILIQRADRIINKHIFQLIELVGFAISRLSNIEYANHLFKQRVENTPDEVAFFALGDFQISRMCRIATLHRERDFRERLDGDLVTVLVLFFSLCIESWCELVVGVTLKGRDDVLVLALIHQHPIRKGVGLDFQLGLGVTGQVVVPIEQVLSKSAVIENFVARQPRLTCPLTVFIGIRFGSEEFFELPRQTRLARTVEGVDQLHLLLDAFQLFGNFRKCLTHITPLPLPAWGNSTASRGNTRIAFGEVLFHEVGLR